MRRAAGRLGEDPFGLRDQLHGIENLAVGGHRAGSAARADRLSTWKPSAGLPIAIERAMVFGLTGSGNSRPSSSALMTGAQPAACAAWIAGRSPLDQPDFLQLAERARDARQQRAAGHRRDDVLREFPAELLGDFEAVGLRAFRVVAAQVDVRKPPAVFFRNLRAQPVHIVVVAFDGDDLRVVDAGAENLARLPDRSG